MTSVVPIESLKSTLGFSPCKNPDRISLSSTFPAARDPTPPASGVGFTHQSAAGVSVAAPFDLPIAFNGKPTISAAFFKSS
jgi:hypothetical protein